MLIVRKRNYFSFLNPFLAQELETAGKATFKISYFSYKDYEKFCVLLSEIS